MSKMSTVALLLALVSAVLGENWWYPENSIESKFIEETVTEENEWYDFDKDNEVLQAQHNNEARKSYSGAQVWRVFTEKKSSRDTLFNMEETNLVSTWREGPLFTDIFVESNKNQDVANALQTDKLYYDIIIEDVQKLIDEENPVLDEDQQIIQGNRGHNMTWKNYHRLNDIHQFLDYLAKTYPAYISVQSIGKSHEKRDMKLLKISNGKPNNKAIFIDGGIHAREWISPATVTYLTNHIAENFNAESDFKNIDWYILPVLNPDGYEYTHTTKRDWRKNRRPIDQECEGVDLNRNFGYKWGGQGSSNHPCSETYHGSTAFSEPESKSVSDFIKNSGVKFSAYLTYHSYGQYVLYPWGYDNVLPPDHEDLHDLGEKVAKAIKQTGGNKYRVGSSTNMLGAGSGGSDDWAKSEGIKYSYTIELPDTGEYAFYLPASYILPVGKESLAGLRVVAAQVLKE